MFDRLIHLWNVMQTSWEEDQSARGAAKMTVGAILMFEGVFGKIRNFNSRKKNSKNVGGIMGSIVSIIIGLILIMASNFWVKNSISDPIIVKGVVVEHKREMSADADRRSYRAVYSYNVEGNVYRIASSGTTPMPLALNSEVEIMYSKSNPEIALRNDGIEGIFNNQGPVVVKILGWLIIISALISLLISIVLIYIGVKLFLSGRRERKAANQNTGFINDLLSIFSKIKSGEIRLEDTAAGKSGCLS